MARRLITWHATRAHRWQTTAALVCRPDRLGECLEYVLMLQTARVWAPEKDWRMRRISKMAHGQRTIGKLAQNWRMKNDFEMRASFSSLVRLLSLHRIFQFFNFFGNSTPSFSFLSLISLLTLIFRDLSPPIKTRRKRMYRQRDHATRKTRKDEGDVPFEIETSLDHIAGDDGGVLANKCHPTYPSIWQVLACFRLYRD